jgi:hypothetical protein
MKTLTQVVLPIAAVVGLVFGITFIANYSANNPAKKGDGTKGDAKPEPPLRFSVTVGRNDPTVPFLRNWKSDYEAGEHGHFDFWFQNSHEQEVRVAFTSANCQCAGAELGIVPPEAWRRHLEALAAAAASAAAGAPAAAAVANDSLGRLESQMTWLPLVVEGKKSEAKVPAAPSATEPQVGCIRVNWSPKESEEPNPAHRLTADFVNQLPGATGANIHLEVLFSVVPPFGITTGGSERSIRLGAMTPGAVVNREFYCSSKTRPELDLTITPRGLGEHADLVSVSKPEPLSEAERADFARRNSGPDGGPPLVLTSAYRVRLTVRERAQIEKGGKKVLDELDLGPFDFQLEVKAGGGKPITVPVVGTVRGEVRVLGSEGADRIDFGSFSGTEARTREVTLVSDRDGLDLELVKAECTPDYLDPQLVPLPEADGAKKKQWRLTVTIPAGKLSETLANSYVVLKTKDPQPRKIRIPVKASAFSSGSPRF